MRALNDLVDSARALGEHARALGEQARSRGLDHMALTLDATRTRLVQDGIEYLDTAWAIIDAARGLLACYQIALER